MPTKPGSKKRKYGYQSKQTGAKMQGRVRSRNEYHTHRWTKASLLFRQSNPLCARCLAKGVFTPTQVTNHIIPSELWHDFFDRLNREPLCKTCNIEQGNEDKKLFSGAFSQQQLDTIRQQRVQNVQQLYKQNGLQFKQV